MNLESGKNGNIITFNGINPKIHPSVFICSGVHIIGDVEIDEDTSIWYNTVIRGDVNYIRIGKRNSIQDLSMLHVTTKTHPLIIGSDITIAHSVTLHGCTLEDKCFIGMGATVLDGAVISSNSLIAAGAVIREGFHVPEGVLVAGVPGKIVRNLSPEDIIKMENNIKNYLGYVKEYKNQLYLG